ncbi:MAG: membrane dipeptidase [Pseudomonadota bacterium]
MNSEHTAQTSQPRLAFARLLAATAAFTLAGCALSRPATEAAPSLASDADIDALHASALVVDAHADIIALGERSPYAGDDGRSQVEPDKMRAGGVDLVVMAIAVGPMPRNPAGYAAARSKANEELEAAREIAASDANTVIVRSAADIERAQTRSQQALLLGFQNALILGRDQAALDEFYAAGARVFALTHMGHNDYADSSRPLFIAAQNTHEPDAEHGGLSALGRRAIARINALGGLIDVSQLSSQATLQAISQSSTPVIASHSNVRALCDVSRNLSDAELDALGRRGGVVHIAPFRGYLFDSGDAALIARIREARRAAELPEDYLYPFELYWEIDDPEARAAFTGAISELLGPGSLDVMLDHIDYVARRIGPEHVGIGTDFNHGSGIDGFADASEARNITAGLVARGYSAEDIRGILGGNFLRVLRAAEAGRRP